VDNEMLEDRAQECNVMVIAVADSC